MRRRTSIIVLWVAASLLTWPRTGRAAAEPWLVVPGQSLGPVRLGMPSRDLVQLGWGQPDQTHIAGSIAYYSYSRQRVTIAIRDQVVALALTTNERYRTDKGLAVGQPAGAATSTYGAASASEDRVHWYDAIGLVVITGANTIIRLGVFDPKTLRRAVLADERPARDVLLTARSPKYGRTAKDQSGGSVRSVQITITLKNASTALKVMNPSFVMLVSRDGKTYKFDRSTFGQSDACRSTVSARAGASASCTVVFMIPPGEVVRSVVFNDGASIDEFFF